MKITKANNSLTISRSVGRPLVTLLLTSLVAVALPTRSHALPGSVDTSFDAGYVDNGVLSVALQQDGKILIGGSFANVQSAPRNGIARLNSNGSVDTNFDPGSGTQRNVGAIALQTNGKIVFFASGRVARLNADGTSDASFNLATASPPNISSIAVQSDDKIVVVGLFTTIGGSARKNIARLNADGSLDSSFDPGTGPNNSIDSLAFQGDGKIVIAGSFSTFNGVAHKGIARLDTGGILDSGFNSSVLFSTTGVGGVQSMAVQPNGKIVLAGSFVTVNDIARPYLARLDSNGTLDSTFNPGMGPDDFILAVAVQLDGRIVLAGGFHNISGASREHIGRVNADGSLDTSFDPGSGANAQVYCLALQPDGRILLGGFFTTVNGVTRGRIARLNGDLAPGQLLNISTRLKVQTGENVLIGGFIITGTDSKKVIIRGIGPSLPGAGVTLSDPTLELHQGSMTLATNDNWKIRSDGGSQQSEIEATTIPPTNDAESALVTSLPPGAYTAIVAGKGNTTGVGLVEVYDLNQTAASKLANISTRGFVDLGDNVMIGGFIIGPAAAGNTRVIVRALGPTLTSQGIAGALQDTTLELHDGNGALLAMNDDWKETQQVEIQATTIPPNDDRESAILQTLVPGNYTAIVRGKGSTTGVGLVEVYNVP